MHSKETALHFNYLFWHKYVVNKKVLSVQYKYHWHNISLVVFWPGIFFSMFCHLKQHHQGTWYNTLNRLSIPHNLIFIHVQLNTASMDSFLVCKTLLKILHMQTLNVSSSRRNLWVPCKLTWLVTLIKEWTMLFYCWLEHTNHYYTYQSLQTSLSDRLIHHSHGRSEDQGDKEHEQQLIQNKPQKRGWSWRHQHQKPVKKREWLWRTDEKLLVA